MGVPQVAMVLGHCTAGGAYVPALSEYNVIVQAAPARSSSAGRRW
jgi:3-methylcrotonyl-CoA carboxylase beta subunit